MPISNGQTIMAESWVPGRVQGDSIRPGGGTEGRGRAERLPGQSGSVGGLRQRIPSPRQLAALIINGLLNLPRNYRRGMFLDIWV
ncbi:conserved hypothetical protein [uncultured Gammaproteobacteria bacterium]